MDADMTILDASIIMAMPIAAITAFIVWFV